MDKYFMWIHYERLHNHNKAKHNKTVCIFLGIYCRLPILRVNEYIKTGGRYVYRRGGTQYKCFIPFCQTMRDLPPLFPTFLGQVVNFGGTPPSLTLHTTLIQVSTGIADIERLYWKYIYLKARDNSYIMHLYNKNLQLISKIKWCHFIHQLYNSTIHHQIMTTSFWIFYWGHLGFVEKKILNPIPV